MIIRTAFKENTNGSFDCMARQNRREIAFLIGLLPGFSCPETLEVRFLSVNVPVNERNEWLIVDPFYTNVQKSAFYTKEPMLRPPVT